ncbi:ankyrin repeat-containing domain protein [Geranomyces variabilis]|nr:ankyrin repeat-containing domain protein [Geranomyces variabilis]KAJ3139497.1 hypothetical protein HDU90_008998 [Geranomyces variabilis]
MHTSAPADAAADFDLDELVACARYDDLDGLIELVDTYHAAHPKVSLRKLYSLSLPNSRSTALHQAAANGCLPILKHILPAMSPADINAANADGSTALHWAALNGKLDCVELLLQCGADATIKNDLGRSPSTVAEQQGHMDVVNALLKSFEPEESGDEEESIKAVEKAAGEVAAREAAGAGEPGAM